MACAITPTDLNLQGNRFKLGTIAVGQGFIHLSHLAMQDEEHHAHLLPREANRLPSVEGSKGCEPRQRQPRPLGHVSAGLCPKEEGLIEGLQVGLRANLGYRLKELSAGGVLEVRAPEADGRPGPAAGTTLPTAVPTAWREGAWWLVRI